MNAFCFIPRKILAGIPGLLLLSVSGCGMMDNEPVSPKVVTPAPVTGADREIPAAPVPSGAADSAATPAELTFCQQQLTALKRIDAHMYTPRQAAFSRLMAGATQYGGVRGSVDPRTQAALDALYQYKIGRLCADIAHDVLSGLSRQAGGNE